MKFRKVLTIAIVAALGLTVAAWAADKAAAVDRAGPHCLQAQPGHPLANLVRNGLRKLVAFRGQLNLTDDQRDQIRDAIRSHKDELVPVVKDIMTKREALRQAVLADAPSEADIRAAADNLGKSIGDAAVLASKVAGEVKPILTDEQKSKIRDFRTERKATVEKFLDEAMQP